MQALVCEICQAQRQHAAAVPVTPKQLLRLPIAVVERVAQPGLQDARDVFNIKAVEQVFAVHANFIEKRNPCNLQNKRPLAT